ncbi:DPP IV N-terminal domain-containing protein [Fodinicola feengrottensis]|uniref:DPP IV N-terminal domain-containing protein n=1 Tax=Fodinicola feengrottensis TaxID=435914 RepID=UPI0013D47765|nr:DPP IV N-terminal domain-containing protein [Fodinicola feengrottensis]
MTSHPEERVRRERARERSTGITAYATDSDVEHAVFALAGRLWTVEVGTAAVREWPTAGPIADPRPNPAFTAVAYVSAGSLHVIDLADGTDRVLARSEAADLTYGLPEHVASESMHRFRGYWWAPDGRRLLVARVDTSPVERLYLSDPTHPAIAPTMLRYPLAGTANAEVTLSVRDLDGTSVAVEWDRDAYEYVVDVHWSAHGLLLAVQKTPADDPAAAVREPRHRHVHCRPGRPRSTVDNDSRRGTGPYRRRRHHHRRGTARTPEGWSSTAGRSARSGCRCGKFSVSTVKTCCSPRHTNRPRTTCGNMRLPPASSRSPTLPVSTVERSAAVRRSSPAVRANAMASRFPFSVTEDRSPRSPRWLNCRR